ncbi:MAG: SIR2 family protein [Armatimonadota bacterium]|nr:SIR2 family protein [Armatimonadota bacterium]
MSEGVKRELGLAGPASSEVRLLRARHAAGDLVLFLGAGVPLSAGLPGWEALLHQLTVEMWAQRLGEGTSGEETRAFADLFHEAFGGFPIISGRYIRKALGERFRHCVRRILYGHADATSDLLWAITRLCMPERGAGGVRAVVCYNYDDLLEVHLARQGIRFRSIYAEGQSPRPNEIPIYHVHGYLPREETLEEESELVFAEDAYHTQFLDPYGWANITQLSLLRESTGLFVGFSMTDPNLRRLLDVAHRHGRGCRHYAVMKSPSPEELARGGGRALALERAEEFIRAYQGIQEDALADLGLRVLWVKRFEDVPVLLDAIRQLPDDWIHSTGCAL